MKLILTTDMIIDLRRNPQAWAATIAFMEEMLPWTGCVEIEGIKFSGEDGLNDLRDRLRF
jgi:hypothetical protein